MTAETMISRDRWGRPLIEPADGGKPVAYQRISKLANTLDDTYNLTQWKIRQTIHGLTLRADLLALARSAQGDKQRLNDVAKQAMDAAASTAAANTGTALHSWCELVDMGKATLADVPAEQVEDVTAYRAAIIETGLVPVMAEQFVVNDELRAAGTFDRVYLTPDGAMVVGDLKTGANAAAFPCGVTVQVAVYANSTIYRPGYGRNATPLPVDKAMGVLIHAPAGTGTATVYALDLEAGYEAARLAVRAQKWQKSKPIKPWNNK